MSEKNINANKNKKFNGAIELTRDLVKINSENPTSTELKVQNFLTKELDKMGFEYDIIPFERDRNNIIARFPPIDKTQSINHRYIMFSGHMDTVPGYHTTNSSEAPIKDDKIWGRGTSDMKGAIACFFTAIKEFIKDFNINGANEGMKKIKRGICIALTVDEEMGCTGAKTLKNYKKINNEFGIDLCILGEPTMLYTGVGHKGVVWFMVDFKGRAAHGSTPFYGKNSIEMATKFINSLEKLKIVLKNRNAPDFPDFSPPTLNVGIIKGGNKINVVPANCHVEIDRRLIPEETVESALEEMKTAAKEAGVFDNITIKPVGLGNVYVIPNGKENKFCKEILKITNKYHPKNPDRVIFLSGFTEADPYFSNFKFPVIILGPGGQGIHGPDEYVEISDIINGTSIYYEILKRYILKE
ncbi:MAG: M20 family metallopeptidase [Promethearchaeota archaeon]